MTFPISFYGITDSNLFIPGSMADTHCSLSGPFQRVFRALIDIIVLAGDCGHEW